MLDSRLGVLAEDVRRELLEEVEGEEVVACSVAFVDETRVLIDDEEPGVAEAVVFDDVEATTLFSLPSLEEVVLALGVRVFSLQTGRIQFQNIGTWS